MKKLTATLIASAIIGSAGCAMAAEGDYVVVLNEPAVITSDCATRLSDRVYLVPTYMDALALAPADKVQSIFADEVLEIPETDFDTSDAEYASLSEELPYPDGANDTNYSRQWYLSHIKAQTAWAKGLTGSGVRVGIIDTGVNPLHVDLMNSITHTFNTTSASDTSNVNDTYGHGTMVAGVLAAKTNNNTCVAGITSDAELAIIKILEDNTSRPSIANLLAGISKAIDYECDVINMSLGWTTTNESSASFLAVKQEIIRGVEKGIIFVASSGNINEGSETVPKYFPAAFDNVISVASTGRYKTDADEGTELTEAFYNGKAILADEPSTFSVYNNKVTCAAPGFRIYSTFISSKKSDGTYTDPLVSMAASDGTSYAAPMVASAAVIAKQLDPTINYARFLEYLKKSVRDIYTEGYDEHTGYGMLDIEALINVISEDVINATPTPSPAPLTNFSATVTQNGDRYIINTLYDAAAEDFKIIAAAYKDGRLISVKSQPDSTDSMGKVFPFTCEEEPDIITIMAWTPDGMYPLAECVKHEFATPELTDAPEASTEPTDIPEGTAEPTEVQ